MALKTKPTALLVAAIIIYWVYINFTLLQHTGHWVYGIVFGLAIVGGAAFALNQPWSRFLLYAATAVSVPTWIYSVVIATLDGLGYTSLLAGFFGLLISAVPPAIGIGCSLFAFRHFRVSSGAA